MKRLHRASVRSLRSLCQSPLRSLLSILGIVFGVMSVITMLSIGEGAKRETLELIEQLGMNNIIIRKISSSHLKNKAMGQKRSPCLKMEDIEIITNRVHGIKEVCPIQAFEKTVQGSSVPFTCEIVATTPSFASIKNLSLKEGRFLCNKDCENRSLVCVLGGEIAKTLGLEGKVGHSLRLSGMSYTIVGVLELFQNSSKKKQSSLMSHDIDQVVLVPLTSLSQKADLSEVVFHFSNNAHLKFGKEVIAKALIKKYDGLADYQIVFPQELLNKAKETKRTFESMLIGSALISLLVGGIGIMNIMLTSVSERTREIGIRRAVGASQRDILIQFLFDALVLTLCGALIGLLMGIFLSLWISAVANWRLVITPFSIFLSFLMAFVVGVGSGLYPAYRAAKMDPILALRSL